MPDDSMLSRQSSSHPETVCRRCGGPNVSWSAPSPLWNAVMRGGSIDGPQEFGEIICPTCFVVLAEERGVASEWQLDAETVNVELETVTPSGRLWDGEKRLWVEPVTTMGVTGDGAAWVRHGSTSYRVRRDLFEWRRDSVPSDYLVTCEEGPDVLDHDMVRSCAHTAFLDAFGGP